MIFAAVVSADAKEISPMPMNPPPPRIVRRLGSRFLLLLAAYLVVSTVLPLAAAGAETSNYKKPKPVNLKKLLIKSHLTAKNKRTLEKIRKLRSILGYEVVFLGERLYRDTYFDSADLYLYRNNMFYRVREDYDGQVKIEFQDRGSIQDDAFTRPIYSASVPLDRVSLAKQGRLTDNGPARRLKEAVGNREVKKAQLFVESYGTSILLRKDGKRSYRLTLTSGKYVGLDGKKLKRPFWAIEVEMIARPSAKTHVQELKRITNFLLSEFELQGTKKSVYQRGIEKAVLVRPEETLIYPIRVLGGTRGELFEQFNLADAVAFTPDGRLLAGDTDNARFKIYTFRENRESIQIIGQEGSKPGEFDHALVIALPEGRKIFHQVQGIALNKNGLIYVVDQGNRRLQAFSVDGRALPERTITIRDCPKQKPDCPDGLVPPTKKGEYTSLQGLAIDQEGALYLSDKGMNRVYKFLPDGRLDPAFKFQAFDQATGKPILFEPESLAVHGKNIFVADEGHGNIKIFDRKSGALISAADGFGGEVFGGTVSGLAVLDDYLFVVNDNRDRVVVFRIDREEPRFLHAFAGDFDSADGIGIDPMGRFIALADQGHDRILLFSQPEILKLLESKSNVR